MNRSQAQRDKAKQQAANAIDAIVRAAKELAKAEQAYYGSKPEPPQKPTILSEEEKHAS